MNNQKNSSTSLTDISLQLKVNYNRKYKDKKEVFEGIINILINNFGFQVPEQFLKDEHGTGDLQDGSFFSFWIYGDNRIDIQRALQKCQNFLKQNNFLPKSNSQNKIYPIEIIKIQQQQNLSQPQTSIRSNNQNDENLTLQTIQILSEFQYSQLQLMNNQQNNIQQQKQIIQDPHKDKNYQSEQTQEYNQNQYMSANQRYLSEQNSQKKDQQITFNEQQNASLDSTGEMSIDYNNSNTQLVEILEKIQQNNTKSNQEILKKFDESIQKLENSHSSIQLKLENGMNQQNSLFKDLKNDRNQLENSMSKIEQNQSYSTDQLSNKIISQNSSIQEIKQDSNNFQKQIFQLESNHSQLLMNLSDQIVKQTNQQSNQSKSANNEFEKMASMFEENYEEIDTLQKELISYNNPIQQIKQDSTNLQKQISELESSHSQLFMNLSYQINEQAIQQLDQSKSANNEFEKIMNMLKESQGEMETLKKELISFSSPIQKIKQDSINLQKQISQLDSSHSQLLTNLSDLIGQQTSQYSNESKSANNKLEKIESMFEENQGQINKLQIEFNTHNKLVFEVKNKNDEIEKAINNLETNLSSTAIKLSKDVTEQNKSIDQMINDNSQLFQLVNLINKLDNKIQQIAFKQDRKFPKLKRLFKKLRQQNLSINTLLIEIQDAHIFQESQEEKIKSQQQQIEQFTTQIQQFQQTAQQKVTQILSQFLELAQSRDNFNDSDNPHTIINSIRSQIKQVAQNRYSLSMVLTNNPEVQTKTICELIRKLIQTQRQILEFCYNFIISKLKSITYYLWLPNLIKLGVSKIKNTLFYILPQYFYNKNKIENEDSNSIQNQD